MLDDLDLKILCEFCKLEEDEESTTWDIMKLVFKDGWNKENTLIKRKIRKMSNLGLFKINGDKRKTYILDDSKVSYKNFNFPDGNNKGIAVFLNGSWEIYEL